MGHRIIGIGRSSYSNIYSMVIEAIYIGLLSWLTVIIRYIVVDYQTG